MKAATIATAALVKITGWVARSYEIAVETIESRPASTEVEGA
jgi:hypothetical protein